MEPDPSVLVAAVGEVAGEDGEKGRAAVEWKGWRGGGEVERELGIAGGIERGSNGLLLSSRTRRFESVSEARASSRLVPACWSLPVTARATSDRTGAAARSIASLPAVRLGTE